MNLILCLIFLIGVVLFARHQRNKYYSIKCPRCGSIIHPQTTGLMDSVTHVTHYKYKCKCGYRKY